ncbi:MAG: hypothetical protein AB2L14_24510 [Candidatus Xenobiia bacterium LiM19]
MSPEPEEEGKKPAHTASPGTASPAEDSALQSEDSFDEAEDSASRAGDDSTVTKGTACARTLSESSSARTLPPSLSKSSSARALPPSQSDSASARTLPPSLSLPSGNDPVYLAKISGWNWGACAFHGIWMYCFGMQLMGIIIFLASIFIPCAAFVIPIYLGIKGDDLAWRNRHFESYEQFREVIGIWNRWGIGFIVITSTLAIGVTAFLCWYLWQLMQMFTPQMCI